MWKWPLMMGRAARCEVALLVRACDVGAVAVGGTPSATPLAKLVNRTIHTKTCADVSIRSANRARLRDSDTCFSDPSIMRPRAPCSYSGRSSPPARSS